VLPGRVLSALRIERDPDPERLEDERDAVTLIGYEWDQMRLLEKLRAERDPRR